VLTIAYTSTANGEFTHNDLDALLISARETNARLKITGALLFRHGRFIQIIEGAADTVRALYASIMADPRHRDIHVVADEVIARRRFPAWTMGFHALTDISERELPGPEEFFVTHPGGADRPDNVRRAQSLFDWMEDYWLAPVGTHPEVDHPSAVAPGSETTLAAGGASVVVAAIFNKILADIDSGSLLPGDILRDGRIAELLGTSRTPVREALQKLRTIGVVETSASRFTRISIVSPEKAARSIIVIAALYAAVLEEVIGNVDNQVIEAMHADRVTFLHNVAMENPMHIAISAAAFYMRLVAESQNLALREGINAVIHVVKLAGQHLDQLIGIDVISASQEVLLAATIAGDVAEAKRGLAMLTESPRPTVFG